ncbi:hypothetical protein Q4551_12710 [Oceanobacter sp. 5_MG-2023]|uniref:hypothetical protein n=1 Tax=Oceanobacter sp. 5_MG-2023 TaxID=3062645 RepID=UPI0026E1930D|nr:hypothetical protein [Oceanobacter sp. 5_MG-2023]MDO6683151.1 hypothetical protein [Oceanobacter sp. 5_MG-2023]
MIVWNPFIQFDGGLPKPVGIRDKINSLLETGADGYTSLMAARAINDDTGIRRLSADASIPTLDSQAMFCLLPLSSD